MYLAGFTRNKVVGRTWQVPMGDTTVSNCQDGEVRHETAGYISSVLRDALGMPFVAPFVAPFEARIAFELFMIAEFPTCLP